MEHRAMLRGDHGKRASRFVAATLIGLLGLSVAARAGDTRLVSAAPDGTTGDDASGSEFGSQSISASGRYVSFESMASDLGSEDTNGTWDIYVWDRKKGTRVRASVPLDGDAAGGGGQNASLSASGRFVAFQSSASDLVEDDGNGTTDIFVRDLKKGVTTRVSVDSAGVEALGSSFNPYISAGGRYVVFQSDAENLVADDDNEDVDVFVHDRKTGTTTRASVDSAGAQVEGDSLGASVSANGRFVVFESNAPTLVAQDLNSSVDVFLRDLKLGTTVRLSVAGDGEEGDATSTAAMISVNGRFVAFASSAANLVDDDGTSTADIFVRDLKAGTIERVSVDTLGDDPDQNSGPPWITRTGRFVSFESHATDLVADDGNGAQDIFLADRKKGTLVRVSVQAAGAEAGGSSSRSAVSANGRFVAFDSDAGDLSADDDNRTTDVFLRDTK